MEIGIFPVVLIAVGLGIGSLRRARSWDRVVVASLAASAGLMLLGFGLGFAINGSSTVVPAHYHAAIGAVTGSARSAGR
mgnify:CR=1 FL=1